LISWSVTSKIIETVTTRCQILRPLTAFKESYVEE